MNTKKKRTPNQKKKAIVSVLLMVAILITGAFAFLSAQDSKTNVFTVGNVKVKLSERFDTNLDGEIQEPDEVYDSSDVTEIRLDDGKTIMPGQKIIKSPYVENTGKNEAWTYVVVGIPTTNSDAVFRDDSGNTAIAGQDVSIKITAYAIQDKYKDKTTSEDVWNAYFTGKEVSTFGALETSAENLSARVPLFTVLNDSDFDSTESIVDNSCNSEWTMLTHNIDGKKAQVYCSSDGYDYYIFGYNNKLAALADGEEFVKTTPVFKGVKLQKDIGEARPVTLNYYKAEQTGNTGAGETDLSTTSSIPEGYTLIKTEYYTPGSKVATLYYDDTLAKTGYSFDWKFTNNTGKSAYSGMTITEDTDLIADYTNETESSNPQASSYLFYSLYWDEELQNFAAVMTGADKTNSAYPTSPTTVIVPPHISFTRISENEYVIEEGVYREIEVPEGKFTKYQEKISIGTKYTVPVVKAQTDSRYSGMLSGVALREIAKKIVFADSLRTLGQILQTVGGLDTEKSSSTLEEVVMPYSCDFSATSFEGQKALKSVKIPNTAKSIMNNCFSGTALTEITIPQSVERIFSSAFANCEQLTNISILGEVKISREAFKNCKNLTSITLPNSMETIEYSTFSNCSSLTDIIIPNSVTNIEDCAFENCNNLKSITYQGTVSDWAKVECPPSSFASGLTITCTDGTVTTQ